MEEKNNIELEVSVYIKKSITISSFITPFFSSSQPTFIEKDSKKIFWTFEIDGLIIYGYISNPYKFVTKGKIISQIINKKYCSSNKEFLNYTLKENAKKIQTIRISIDKINILEFRKNLIGIGPNIPRIFKL